MISSLQLSEATPHLLALDLGLRFGWACYQQDSRLVAYGSHHCGQANKLNSVAYQSIIRLPKGSALIVEGGGDLLKYWTKYALKYDIDLFNIHAERWRTDCLPARCLNDGKRAKKEAINLSQSLILSRAGRGATSLRHDTAEACLIGWWGLRELGWINETEWRLGLGGS